MLADKIRWADVAFFGCLAAITWACVAFQARQARLHRKERGKVCKGCYERLAEPDKNLCRACAQRERAKELSVAKATKENGDD